MIEGKPDILTLNKPLPGDFCILCGGKPGVIGIFVPDDPEAWGAPGGKTRVIRYCLCERCARGENVQERVEKIIRAELSGGGSRC
jgi:hypothetical protein